MKRKLLTVLLAVVMVFGVFGLTACGGSNADADYNYYGVKYEIEDEVKIQAVTYQAVYKMFTTAGRYLLYVDSETSENVKANFQAINKFANDWNVTVYHFNPDLTGGYAKTAKTENANILKATGTEGNIISTAQATLLKISNTTIASWTDSTLVGVIGAESTASAIGELVYNGKVAKTAAADKAAEVAAAICQQKVGFKAQKPSFGAYTDAKADKPLIPEAYMTEAINTMNLFGDARLHMYNDDNGVDALTAEKEDVYVTLANYTMFAHLMDNNQGYFPVFFGGTWCPNTQAIVKITDKLAKDFGIEKIYFFDPNLTDGAIADSVVSDKGTFSYDKYQEDIMYNIDAAKAAVTAAEDALAKDDGKDADKTAKLTKAVADAKVALKTLEDNKGYTISYSVKENGDYSIYGPNTRDSDKNSKWAYAYASFLDNYLPTYTSEWNVGTTLKIGGKDYTKMCVPNIMMFNGEAEGKAELVALAEAEYYYANVNVEGDPCNVAWTEAVKNVFDANPYAKYAPIMVAEAAPEASAPAASAPAASSSSSEGAC